MKDWMIVTPRDSVAVALKELPAGADLPGGGYARESIPAGHKVALENIPSGMIVVKYGQPIGIASAAIRRGDWVHRHNLRSQLSEITSCAWRREEISLPSPGMPPSFMGYHRPDGSVGIRNELWVIPNVGCAAHTAHIIAEAARRRYAGCFTGVVSFAHPYGCSQSGEDAARTRDLIAALARHPNAAGTLIVGLGCEDNRLGDLMPLFKGAPHIVGFDAQMPEDEVTHALRLIEPIADAARRMHPAKAPITRLCLGLKCGGSDGYSGLTANPLLGALCDRMAAWGAACAMTEVPEMFGAEHLLMSRAIDERVYRSLVAMIDGYKLHFTRRGEPVDENPSPGNHDGGITTLEEKSLGCTQKGGGAPVTDVVGYAERVSRPGLTLVWGPGNDMVSCTALAAAGCQMILFTTGRGTPYGGPVPTLKLSTHSALARRKPAWIDFDAGMLLEDADMPAACDRLIEQVVATASGRATRSETHGYREIAVFHDGVTK